RGATCRNTEFAIGDDLAELQLGELLPHGLLERCARPGDGEVEAPPRAGEVFAELLGGALEQLVGALGQFFEREMPGALHGERGDGRVGSREFDATDRALDAAQELRGR